MAELTWAPDGEEIFGRLMAAVPEPMRDMIKPKLLEVLVSRASGNPVTADIVIQMVREDLPEPQKSVIIDALGLDKAAEKKPAQKKGSGSTWSGKSETMFEIMLEEVPDAMRDVFRGKLMAVLSQKAHGSAITEDHVTAVVNEMVPEPFQTNILKKFKELGDFDIRIIDEIINRHGTSQDNLMYILHDTQDEIGYLPVEALSAISNKTGIKLSTVYNIVTFYKAFKLQSPGRHHVKICCGTACFLKDNTRIAQQVEDVVNANPGTTMEKTLCLGCCDCAPVFEIDGQIYKGDEAKNKIESL